MMNKLFFQINDGEPQEFASLPEGETFTLSITQFPTKTQLEELSQTGGRHYHIVFTDKQLAARVRYGGDRWR